MKKLLLPILVGASMSFAGISLIGLDEDLKCGVYAPDFKISNEGSDKPINGFKIYAYFSSDNVNAKPEIRASVHDANVDLQQMTPHVWRVVVDYSNKVIPARGVFPSGVYANPVPAVFATYFEIWAKLGTENRCWAPYPWRKDMMDIVIESASGQLLKGRHPNFKSLVGVLGSWEDCPARTNGASVSFRLDVEDKNNLTKISGAKPVGISYSDEKKKDVWFSFCPVVVKNLPRTTYDYMVLRLDESCPDGSYPVRRHHDTEDSNNINRFNGMAIWPSKVVEGGDADLEFCFVPRTSNHNTKFPFGTKYGVFANPTTSIDQEHIHHIDNVLNSVVYIDDEDNNNQNDWNYYGLDKKKNADKAIIDGIHKIMYDDDKKNTIYHVIRWNTANYVSKSADVAQTGNVAVENTLVAAAPLAPAVKGLNRNAVAVELKSAGDVKVSIVGVNGAVIANIAEKNLQAGVHQIKWNAGMVPNGRYIVKVEQNGMVNAKNVILK